MANNYSTAIWEAIENFLQQDVWKYETHEDHGVISCGVSLKCKAKSAKIWFAIKKDGFLVQTILPFSADDDTKAAAAEFITRANYGMLYGNFEMDFNDGEIRFKTAHYADDTVPAYDQIRFLLYMNIFTVERYADGLMKVIFGMADPAEVIKEIEAK